MKEKQTFKIVGIIMLGVVMRAPFTAIPTILPDVAAGLGVSVSDLGILTSIPLLMFALCSSLAPRLAARFGMEKLMAMVLLTMTVGSFMRIANLPLLYVGTMLLGAAVAIINVLLPSLVAHYFPRKIGLYTTIYITLMGCAATLAAVVAVPIVLASSWQFFILLLSACVALAFLLWLPNIKDNHYFEQGKQAGSGQSLWKNKAALILLVFGGLQSLLFYTEITWLPTISQAVGLTKAEAGVLAGIYNLTSIPVSMVVPAIISRLKQNQRAWLMIALSALTLLGLAMMLVSPPHFGLWLAIHLILGISNSTLFPYLMLSFSLKTSSNQATAQLSGMVQTGGYLIASIGPVILGYSYPIFGSWNPLILVLILVTAVMMWTIYLIEKKDVIV